MDSPSMADMPDYEESNSHIFKVTNITTSTKKKIKYVFVGSVPSRISSILKKLSAQNVSAITHLEYFELCEQFGVDWEFTLGHYEFHQYSGLITSNSFRRDFKHILSKNGIKSVTDFRRYRGRDPIIINCGRRLYGSQLLKSYDIIRADKIYFNADFQLRMDDDIKTLKQKIAIAMSNFSGQASILPDWIHLFSVEGYSVGIGLNDMSTDTLQTFPPGNPREQFSKFAFSQGTDDISKKLRSRFLRIVNLGDTILHDYLPLSKNELALYTLPDFLSDISSEFRNLQTISKNISEFTRIFLNRFFSNIDQDLVIRFINNDFSTTKSDQLLQIRSDILKSEDILNLFAKYSQIFPSTNHIYSITCDVFKQNLHSLKNDDNIDLKNLFHYIHVDHNLIFVAYKSIKSSQIRSSSGHTLFKIKKDWSVLRDKLREVKFWLNPLGEYAKPNSLVLRYFFPELSHAWVTVILDHTGHYRIIVNWSSLSQASSMIDFHHVILKLKNILTKYISDVDVRRDKTSSFQFALPRYIGVPEKTSSVSQSSNSHSNVMIKNMSLRMEFECKKSFHFESIRRLTCIASPFFVISPEQSEISRFWKRTPRYSTVMATLEKLQLNNIATLANLSNSDWNSLQLINNSKANSRLVDEFRRFVLTFTSDRITLYFKRHSRYETLRIHKQIIAEFLQSNNISLSDALSHSDIYATMISEIRRKLGLTDKEAHESLAAFGFDSGNINQSRLASGIKCDIRAIRENRFRVSVHGVRNFTSQTSVHYLLDNLSSFFSQFFGLYESTDLSRIFKDYRDIWSKLDSIEIDNEHPPVIDDAELSNFLKSELDLAFQFDDIVDENDKILSDKIESDNDIEAEDAFDTTHSASFTLDAHSPDASSSKGSYHLNRLQKRDPYLFVKRPNWKKSFATTCQKSGHKQPIILTPDEYHAQDKSTFRNPFGLPDGFNFRNHYYICPEIWCPRMNRTMHPHQLQDAKYISTDLDENGNPAPKIISGICPDGEKAMIANDGIGGWKAKGISSKDPTRGRMEFPGFISNLHPDGIGVPCCFQHDQSVGRNAEKFYKLLAGETVNKSKGLAETSQRYRKRSTSFPLFDMRFGDLVPKLDHFFNKGPPEDPTSRKIYHDKYHRFLRMGIPQTDNCSFISCIARIFDLYLKTSQFSSNLAKFRSYLSEHLHDETLFRSLANGNVFIIFQDFSFDDALTKFRIYLENEDCLDIEYLWDLFCRPLPWLFPDGLNIYILQQSSDGISAKLPNQSNLNDFYDPNRQGIFLVTDGIYYEPVVLVDNSLSADPFFSPTDSFHRMKEFVPILTNSCPTPKHIVLHLARSKSPQLQPTTQFVNSYNRVEYIGVQCGAILPLCGLDGPFFESNFPIPIQDSNTATCSGEAFLKCSKNFTALLNDPCKVDKVIPDPAGNPAAFLLTSGKALPISNAAKFVAKFGLSTESVFDKTSNEFLYKNTQVIDDRIKQISRQKFILFILDQLKFELAQFLQNDLKSKSSKSPFWNSIHKILHGVDKDSRPLPNWAKFSLLMALFLDSKSGLMFKFVSPRKKMFDQPSEFTFDRHPPVSPCSTPSGLSKTSCEFSRRDYCHWHQNKCKIIVPEELLEMFCGLIASDLIMNTFARDMIMYNRFSVLMDSGIISIDDSQITFDDDVASYVLHLIEQFNGRGFRKSALGEFLAGQKNFDPVRRVKEHIIFRGFVQPISSMFASASSSLHPLPKAWTHQYIQPTSSIGSLSPSAVFDVTAYVVSRLFLNSTYDQQQLKSDIARFLASGHKVSGRMYWHKYLTIAKQVNHHLSHVETLRDLSHAIQSSSFVASIEDLRIVSSIHPLSFRVFNPTGKNLHNFGTTKNVLVALYDSPYVTIIADRQHTRLLDQFLKVLD